MKQVYQADDGTVFDTEAECKEYENVDALHDLIEESIGVTYNDDAGFHCIEVGDVKTFIERHIDEIIRIVKGNATVSTSDDGWISNEGNSADKHPVGVLGSTLVEIEYRSGRQDRGYANNWTRSWCSTDDDSLDIVAYRVVE